MDKKRRQFTEELIVDKMREELKEMYEAEMANLHGRVQVQQQRELRAKTNLPCVDTSPLAVFAKHLGVALSNTNS